MCAEKSKMAQAHHCLKPCTICQSPIEYHCNTCACAFCSKCRDNHLESNASKHHNVVPFSERIEPNKPPLQCTDHPGHQCGVWCKTCNTAVCSECVTSDSHEGHCFLKSDEKIKEKKIDRRKEIQDQFDEYSSLLSNLQNSLQESEKWKAVYETDVKQLDKDIVNQADEMCRQVRTLERESRKQLQEMKDISLKVLQDQQNTLIEGIQRLRGKINLLEDMLRTNDTSTVNQGLAENILDFNPSIYLPLPALPDFIPGSTNIKSLKEMFGSLSDITVQIVDSKPFQRKQILPLLSKPSVESKINIQIAPYSPAIACVDSDEAWVQTAVRRLELVNRQGTVKETVNIDFFISDMAVTPQGDILLPDRNINCIRTMSMEGKVKKLFSTEWEPYGICCLPSGDIVVAFSNARKIFKYSSTGDVLKEIGRSLLKHPWFVAHSQVNGQLYVCDKLGNGYLPAQGRVLVFDMNGRLQYTHTGSDQATFAPVAVCTDQAGHILITDWNNKIHILDKGGTFLQYLMTEEHGLTIPTTIDVDSDGYAWIGEWETGKVKVVKYMQGK